MTLHDSNTFLIWWLLQTFHILSVINKNVAGVFDISIRQPTRLGRIKLQIQSWLPDVNLQAPTPAPSAPTPAHLPNSTPAPTRVITCVLCYLWQSHEKLVGTCCFLQSLSVCGTHLMFCLPGVEHNFSSSCKLLQLGPCLKWVKEMMKHVEMLCVVSYIEASRVSMLLYMLFAIK
jgi:hypothetical protein